MKPKVQNPDHQYGTTLPKRTKGIKRSTKPIPRNAIKRKKRSKAEDERIYGPPAFRTWIHAQMCCVCMARPTFTEQAHIGNGGMGRKASWKRSVPMCGMEVTRRGFGEGCHQRLHRVGQATFEREIGATLESLVERTQAAWQAECERVSSASASRSSRSRAGER